jgi:hypothetical protein
MLCDWETSGCIRTFFSTHFYQKTRMHCTRDKGYDRILSNQAKIARRVYVPKNELEDAGILRQPYINLFHVLYKSQFGVCRVFSLSVLVFMLQLQLRVFLTSVCWKWRGQVRKTPHLPKFRTNRK